jgi:cell division protein FtsW
MASPAPIPPPRSRFFPGPVAVVVVCAIALTCLGLTILFSASTSLKGGPVPILAKQVAGVGMAVLLAAVISRLDLDYLRRYAWWIAGGVLLLLLLVVIPHVGISANGSRRWLGHGAVRLQVSEFAKIGLVFVLAHYLAANQTRLGEFWRGYAYPVGIIGAFAVLIMKEPDFGATALLVSVGLSMLFFAGAKWRYLICTFLLAVAALGIEVAHNPNRARRFTAFMDVEANKNGAAYQLYQAEAAFASGGARGVGLGQGRQQYNYLPEAQNDCILAVIGEELGLPFTLGVVALFGVMFAAGTAHLRRAPNRFQSLMVLGAILLIALQAAINVASVTGMIPTKGMSLPFISAGLSNLILMGILLGILINTQRTWGRAMMPDEARGMREVLA